MHDGFIGLVILCSIIAVPLALAALLKPVLRRAVAWMLKELGECSADEPALTAANIAAIFRRWVQKRFYPDVRS